MLKIPQSDLKHPLTVITPNPQMYNSLQDHGLLLIVMSLFYFNLEESLVLPCF